MEKDWEFLLCYRNLEAGLIHWYLVNFRTISKAGFIGSINLLERIGEVPKVNLHQANK
jgi:hypothetical protein